MWNKENIKKHKKASDLLKMIIDSVIIHIKNNNNITEKELSDFILDEFKKHGLKCDKDIPIVAFNKNTSFKHYFPTSNSKRLTPNTLILIDIWARLDEKNSPYSDITWMLYYGENIPKDINDVFNIVKDTRDKSLELIEINLRSKILPKGKDIDNHAKNIIINSGHKDHILHSTGHSIGFRSPHGKNNHINPKNQDQLLKNMGYTQYLRLTDFFQ